MLGDPLKEQKKPKGMPPEHKGLLTHFRRCGRKASQNQLHEEERGKCLVRAGAKV